MTNQNLQELCFSYIYLVKGCSLTCVLVSVCCAYLEVAVLIFLEIIFYLAPRKLSAIQFHRICT